MEVDFGRPSVVLRALTSADGSAEYRYEDYFIVAAVYGPVPVKSKQEKIDTATIQVVFESTNSPPSIIQNSIAVRLERIFELVLLGTAYPRSLVNISIQPIKIGDNNVDRLFTICFNAAVLALLDAGIYMTCIPIALSNSEGLETIYSHTSTKTTLLYHQFSNKLNNPTELQGQLKKAEEQSQLLFTHVQELVQNAYS